MSVLRDRLMEYCIESSRKEEIFKLPLNRIGRIMGTNPTYVARLIFQLIRLGKIERVSTGQLNGQVASTYRVVKGGK